MNEVGALHNHPEEEYVVKHEKAASFMAMHIQFSVELCSTACKTGEYLQGLWAAREGRNGRGIRILRIVQGILLCKKVHGNFTCQAQWRLN